MIVLLYSDFAALRFYLLAEDGVEGLLGKSGDCLAAEREQREADEAAAFVDAWVTGRGHGNWQRPQVRHM